MRPRAAVPTTLLLAGVLGLTHAGAQDAEPDAGYASPKAVFAAFVAAVKKQDYKARFALLTPDSQTRLAVQLAGASAMFRSDPNFVRNKGGKNKDKLADLDKIMAKHGLTKDVMGKLNKSKDREANKKMIAAAVKDKPGFAGDVMKWFDAAKIGENKNESLKAATLRGVKITGNKASGTMVIKVGGKEMEEPMEFAKIGGGWRIVIPDLEPNSKPVPKEKK